MNTIPTTSKELRIPYTIVGGNKEDRTMKTPPAISFIVLHRGSKIYRADFLQDLKRWGNIDTISVEGPGESHDLENLAGRFPQVRFLQFHDNITVGEQINIAMQEAAGRYVFVFWNDTRISTPVSQKLLERFEHEDILCVVPILQNTKHETIPSVMAPAFYRKKLKIVPLLPSTDGMESLFPFDYIGIYNRERFLISGGYDYSITNPYWQKADFGFRAHMWGETIICNTGTRLQYQTDIKPENDTPDKSYKIFYLKNLSIRFDKDLGYLPKRRFLSYYLKAGGGIIDAVKEFKEARAWVFLNRYRFTSDALGVTDLWEVPEA